jgi:hypothetical protein
MIVMNYRHDALIDAETSTTAATKIIDIDTDEVVSRYVIEHKGTNNGATPTAHGAKAVSKIELVDGSDVLHSTSGIENQAVAYFQTGRLPFMVNEYRNDVQNIQTFEINFGRYLWDAEYAFDPKKFSNPQLKITHNKANGGSAPDASTLSVFADYFDAKRVTPRGMLQVKEQQTYSLTSSAAEVVNIDKDLVLRSIFLQSLSADKQPFDQYNKVKLYENDGKKVIINELRTSDLLKILPQPLPITEMITGTGTGSAVQHFCTPTYNVYGAGAGLDTSLTTFILAQSYGGDVTVTADNAEFFTLAVQGTAPHGAMQIPLGSKNDPADWFDPRQLSALKAKITAGSSVGSSSTCEVLTEQLRTY